MAKKKQSGHQKKARTSQAPSTQKNRTAATASAASVTDTRLKPTKLEREGIKKFPQLAMHGLYPRYVEADGNCMFRALADQLSGTDAEHRRLRAEVCDYIAAHRERFEGFMMDMEFDDYVARMRDELWGDGCALVAFAKIRGVNVIVYSEGVDAPPMRIGCNDDDDLSDAASSIKLSRRKGGKDNTKKKRESAVAAKRMRNSSSRKRTVHGGGGGGGSSKIGDYEPNDGGTAAAEYLGKRRPTFYLALDDEEHYWSVRRIAEPTSGASNIDPNLEGEF